MNGLAYAEYVIYRGEQVWYPSSQPNQAPEHVRAESKEQLPFKEFSLWVYSPQAGLMSRISVFLIMTLNTEQQLSEL